MAKKEYKNKITKTKIKINIIKAKKAKKIIKDDRIYAYFLNDPEYKNWENEECKSINHISAINKKEAFLKIFETHEEFLQDYNYRIEDNKLDFKNQHEANIILFMEQMIEDDYLVVSEIKLKINL